VFRVFTNTNQNPTTPTAPTSKPLEGDNLYVNQQTKQKLNQEYLISSLINHVPHQGRLFTLDYNFNNATFLLTLNKNNLTEANTEFDSYLKQNKIDNRSWFENLVTSYK
jgi:hypothetical protein